MLVQIVGLDGSSSMPEGWGEHRPPAAAPWTDTSVYELHIRDFRYCSLNDLLSQLVLRHLNGHGWVSDTILGIITEYTRCAT